MAKDKSEFNVSYKHPEIKYYWEAFIRQIKLGNPLAAINAYHEFMKARRAVFEGKKVINIVAEF